MRVLPRPYHDDRIAEAVVAYRTDYGAAGLEAVDANGDYHSLPRQSQLANIRHRPSRRSRL